MALLVIGAGFALVGLYVAERFISGALIAFGGAAVVGGVDSVRTRRHRTGRSGSSFLPRVHTGVSAVIFGLAFIVVGGALVVGGLAALLGGGDDVWSWLEDRSGVVAMALGTGIALLGIATALSRWSFESESTVSWQRLPGVVLGVVLVAMGGVVFALGWALQGDPPAAGELPERLFEVVTGWLGLE